MAEIPFVGPSYNLLTRPSGVQRTVNLIPTPQEPGNERTAWVFKDVPGLESFSEPSSGPPEPTILLLHGEGADGSTTFTDYSGYSRTVTPEGDVQVDTSKSKFGSSSIAFSGSSGSAALRIEEGSRLFNLYDYDSTIEFWCWRLDDAIQGLVSSYNSTNLNGWRLGIDIDKIAFYANNVKLIESASGLVPGGSFHHIALTTESRVIKLWINGALAGSTSDERAVAVKDAGPVYFGVDVASGSFGNYFRGHLDEIRIQQGIAAYTTAFTPPTAAFSDLPTKTPFVDSAYAAQTQVAVHMNGVAGNAIFSNQYPISAPNVNTAFANTGVVFSAAQSKFGGSSGYFNGSSFMSSACGLNPDTSTWAARGWVYVTGDEDNFALFSGNNGAAFDTFYVNRVAGVWQVVGAGTAISFADAAVNLNQWYYIEATHVAGVFYLFKDGVLLTSATLSIGNSNVVSLVIGGMAGSALKFTGHMSDVELIVGAFSPHTIGYDVPTTDFIPHNVWPPSP